MSISGFGSGTDAGRPAAGTLPPRVETPSVAAKRAGMGWIHTPESSIIGGFEYVADDRVLIVAFNHGGRFRFEGVPNEVIERLRTAPSKAQFLAQHITGVFRESPV